ncbi:hypothetical protein FHG87_003258 [Trinorchestia longiramus]|nr:hypothetical protein FHG87_003258 [Trinorchestia longiramus]
MLFHKKFFLSDKLENRLKLLMKGPNSFLTPTDCAGFCCYCPSTILKFCTLFHKESSEIEGYRNRIYYLAHRLKVRVPELTEALMWPKSVFIMSIWRMSLVIQLIDEFEVPGEKILRDPWMFYNGLHFSSVDARKKLPQNRKKSTRANVSNLEEKILYLADKLDTHVCLLRAHWRDHRFKIILSKRGFVRTNILLDEGYTLGALLMNIQVVRVPEKRLMERLSVLRKANHKSMIMGVLYSSSERVFSDYCRKLVFAPSLLDQLCDQTKSEGTDVVNGNQSLSPKKWMYNDCVVEK